MKRTISNFLETSALLVISIFLQHFGNGNSSLISLAPAIEVLVNQSTYMNCSTSALSNEIHWYHYHVGGEAHEMKSVYAYGQIYYAYRDDFRIDINISNGTKAYNLLILSAKSKYAGTYLCQLMGIEEDALSIQLIVLEIPILCQSNMEPDGIIGPNSCGMQPEDLRLSCSVRFTGNIAPRLEWRKVGSNGSVLGNVSVVTANSSYTYNVAIQSDLQMDGSSFICHTTRATGTQYNCTSDVVKVLYAVNTSYVTDELIYDEVNCSANTSSRSCRYKWVWFNDTDVQTESYNWTFRIPKLGQYRCEATCQIRMQDCLVTASLVNATRVLATTGPAIIDSVDNPSSILWSVVCAAVCVSSMVIIVIVVCLHRRRICCRRLHEAEERSELMAEGALENPLMAFGPLQSCASDQGELHTPEGAQVEELETELSEDAPKSHGCLQEIVHHELNARRLCTMTLDSTVNAITGLTMLNGELFIVFEQTPEVSVFQAGVLIQVRSLTVDGLENPVDIASSSKDNCLYVSSTDQIVRVDRYGEILASWSIEDGGGTLSVTQNRTVILSLLAKSALMEYSPNGKLIHEVGLPSVVRLSHAVKVENHFVISLQSPMMCDVCVLDANGSVIQSFGRTIKFPVYLTVNGAGCIFVADQQNSCVLMLSPNLEYSKVILSADDGLVSPLRIYLDEEKSRMFVADVRRGDVRVIAFAL